MQKTLSLVVALQALVLVVLALVYSTREVGAGGERAGRVEQGGAHSATGSGVGVSGAEQPVGRESEPPPPTDESPPGALPDAPVDSAVPLVLHGRILDQHGKPLERARITARNAAHESIGSVTANEDGSFALAGLKTGEGSILLDKTGYVRREQDLVFGRAGNPEYRELELRKSLRIVVEIVTPEGKPLRETEAGRRPAADQFFQVVATKSRLQKRLPLTSSRSLRGFGIGEWRDGGILRELSEVEPPGPSAAGVLLLDEDPPCWVSLTMRSHVLQSRLLQPGADTIRFTLAPEELEKSL